MRREADEGRTSLEEELLVSAGCLLIELKRLCLCESHLPSILLSSEDRYLPPSSARDLYSAYLSCGHRLIRRLPCTIRRSLLLRSVRVPCRDYVSPTFLPSVPIKTHTIINRMAVK